MSKAALIVVLRAGPLTMRFDAGDLRYIKFGDREVIRRIYATVRDRNWGTVPSEISNPKFEISDTGFCVTYTSSHRQNEIHFVWQAEIVGAADGSIQFTFDGEAKSTFLRNRIGFCVLHPIRECAGAKCRAHYTNGSEQELAFPDTIAAEQPVTDLHDLAGLAHEIEPGVWAELKFEGDVFEMEDQRNWIDASFKTFCTPLRGPYPVEVKAGTRVKQEVSLKIFNRRLEIADSIGHANSGPISNQQSDSVIRLTHHIERRPLPPIGLGVTDSNELLSDREQNRLRPLRLGHLRIEVRCDEPDWKPRLSRGVWNSRRLGCGLEVTLFLHTDTRSEWNYLLKIFTEARDTIRRVAVFSRGEKSTTLESLSRARQALRDFQIPIGAGTDADLYQLNLQRPPADADFICWSMNPQVHAFDNASIAETPEAAAQQVVSVRNYFPGKPLVVSPVTLKPRFNPVATGPAPAVPPGELPPQVDPRQLSLFAAAWTLAMIKALAESGTDSVTFYETTGWRGVMETDAGSTLPAKFPSIAGAVFPLYHVLADVGEFAGGEVLHTESSDPLNVAALCLQAGQRRRLFFANLSAEPRRTSLKSLDGIALARILDTSTRLTAVTSPEAFRARSSPFLGTELELAPHAIATLDFADL